MTNIANKKKTLGREIIPPSTYTSQIIDFLYDFCAQGTVKAL